MDSHRGGDVDLWLLCTHFTANCWQGKAAPFTAISTILHSTHFPAICKHFTAICTHLQQFAGRERQPFYSSLHPFYTAPFYTATILQQFAPILHITHFTAVCTHFTQHPFYTAICRQGKAVIEIALINHPPVPLQQTRFICITL